MGFTIEQLVDFKQPSEAQLSPDGTHAAFVYGDNFKANHETPSDKTIFVVEVGSGNMRALTGEHTGTNDQPRWSPDSRRIAFLSNRANPKETQLFVCEIDGGAARPLTDLRGCVAAPKWSPDGNAIAFLYAETRDPDPLVVDVDPSFNRVWILDMQSGGLRAVTPEDAHVFEYEWSPDGMRLAVLTSQHPNPMEGWYSARLHTVDLVSGTLRPVCHMPYQIGRLTWSPDVLTIAFVSGVMSDEGNVSGEVYTVPAEGGEVRCVTPDVDYSITWIEWRGDGILYGGRQVEGAVVGSIEPTSGDERRIAKGMYTVNGWGAQRLSVAQNNTFAALREGFDEPPNVYVGSLDDGAWRRLTRMPFDTEHFPPLRVENRYWRGEDGLPVHGYLVYPPDYIPGRRYPLFAHVHGGPSWSYMPRYLSSWERLLTARGCLVLMPNPRGSWGRGHAFQAANVGDLGGGDWRDIDAGVTCLIAEGLADPDRLAVGGWSYGGYLTTWAVTQTNRFRCAVAGASITNYESNYGVVRNREWQTTMFGSNVYDDFDLHRSRSPIAYASRVTTPVLLLHGDRDPYAPLEQSIEFYTALRHFGVPAQLVIYPREPHGFEERAHQIDLYQRIVGWVDKYLFEEA